MKKSTITTKCTEYEGICKIIRECQENGIKTFEGLGIVLQFKDNHISSDTNATNWTQPTADTVEVEVTPSVKEDLEHIFLSDPAKFEQMLAVDDEFYEEYTNEKGD